MVTSSLEGKNDEIASPNETTRLAKAKEGITVRALRPVAISEFPGKGFTMCSYNLKSQIPTGNEKTTLGMTLFLSSRGVDFVYPVATSWFGSLVTARVSFGQSHRKTSSNSPEKGKTITPDSRSGKTGIWRDFKKNHSITPLGGRVGD